jgi:hypothetical protein
VELYATLPFTFYFVLIELIVGTALAMLVVELQIEVGNGFLQFMGISILVTLGLTMWSASGIDAADLSRPLYGAIAAAAAYSIFSFWPRRVPRVAAGVVLTGASGLALANGLAALGPLGYPPLVAASFAAASLALGASMTAMLLGHWYLVAPMLSSRPLLRLTGLFLFALIVQGVILFGLLGATDLMARFGIMVWIRAAFGIVFPLVMGGFVWYACRIRAMRTATGIMYLAVGCVVMGDITAKVLYFLSASPL